jgi:DNA-binding IclR family transcriptional regulator
VPPFAFLTNHGLALLCIAQDPDARMRDIAADVDITERAAQRIVADLIAAGYLDRERVGRRNRYTLRTGLPVSLPASRDVDLGALLGVLLPESSSVRRREAMHSATAADEGSTAVARASKRRKLRSVPNRK